MHGHDSNISSVKPVWAATIVAGLLFASFAEVAAAADRRVSPDATSFDCSSARPGDTVTLSSGVRGPLKVRNCAGTAANPITIRNDPNGTGPTVIRRSSGSDGEFVFDCDGCVGVAIDGSGRWAGAPQGKTYGIKVTTGGGSPAAFLRVGGHVQSLTIRNVEIDGAWPAIAENGIGIHVKDGSMHAVDYPGVWYEDILIEDNYVHDVEGEGLYIGQRWHEAGIPLRNIEIRNNRIEDTGYDGIQLKSAIAGTNLIHHNFVRRVGLGTDPGQLTGISLLDGTGKIYNNWVEHSGDAGIRQFIADLPQSYGEQVCEIFNNVVVESGQVRSTPGHGIASSNRSGYARTFARIFNNTIVGANDSGVNVGSESAGGFVRDNIIVDAEAQPISAPGNVSELNNRVGTSSQMGFVDVAALNFRLKSTSPARNAGSTQYPTADYDGIARPQDGRPDQGAFEFRSGQGAPIPVPPDITSVE